MCVFYPDVSILGRQWAVDDGILGEERRVFRQVRLQDEPLVLYDVLQVHGAPDHLLCGGEGVVCSLRKWHYRHLEALFQRVDAAVGHGLMCFFGKEMQAGVHQGDVCGDVLPQCFCVGMFDGKVEVCGIPAVHHEDAVSGSGKRVGPYAVADDVGIGWRFRQLVCRGMYVCRAFGFEYGEALRCLVHDSFQQRILQVGKSLVDVLSQLPAEYGNRCMACAFVGIGRWYVPVGSRGIYYAAFGISCQQRTFRFSHGFHHIF